MFLEILLALTSLSQAKIEVNSQFLPRLSFYQVHNLCPLRRDFSFSHYDYYTNPPVYKRPFLNEKAAPKGGFSDVYLLECTLRFYLPMLSNSSTISASGAGVSRLTITMTTAEMMKAGSSS